MEIRADSSILLHLYVLLNMTSLKMRNGVRMFNSKYEFWVFVGFFLLTLIAVLAYQIWNSAWIDCPAGCPNKVQRKNKDRDLQPCVQCGVLLWTCIKNHNRLCDVEGCKVDGGIVWICPPRPDGVDMSTEHLHHNGICAVRPRPFSTRDR